MMHTCVIALVRPGPYPTKVRVLGCLRAMGLVNTHLFHAAGAHPKE